MAFRWISCNVRAPIGSGMNDLCLCDGFVGAGAFAGAAIDALVGVDDVGGFSFSDCAYGADICAGAAGDTKVRIDFSRHGFVVFNCCCVFVLQM